jgi:hypothetical protein
MRHQDCHIYIYIYSYLTRASELKIDQDNQTSIDPKNTKMLYKKDVNRTYRKKR